MFEGIDFNFLTKVEGRKLYGYVPKNKNGIIGKSGVTIGTGVDIGNRTRAQIATLDIPENLKQKLFPYCEKRLEDAERYLIAHPLKLTNEEVDQLDTAVIKADLSITIRIFNEDSKVKFEALPSQVKTVVASLAWNLGPNLRRFINTWSCLTNQRWKELYELLYNFPCKPGQEALLNRRRQEASLIKQLIK